MSFYSEQHDAKTSWKFMPDLSRKRLSSVDVLEKTVALARRGWQWIARNHAARADHDRLHVTDRVSVGEKTYVFVVQVDGRRLLIGGTQAALSLLTELKSVDAFREVLKATTRSTKPRSRRKVSSADAKQEEAL